MNGITTHTVPASVFAEFAAGRGGRDGMALLSAAEFSKHLLLIRGVRDHARTVGHPQAAAADAAYAELARLQALAPDAVNAVLTYPAVGAWALHTLRALERPGTVEAFPSQLGGIAAAAAIRAGLAGESEVPVIDGAAMLPALGRITGLDGERVRIRSGGPDTSGGRSEFSWPFDDVPGWEPLRRVTVSTGAAQLSLFVDDVEPYRAPGMPNLRGRLTGDQLSRWRDLLESAWELLTRRHGGVAEEIADCIRTLVPLRPPPVGLNSSTSRETFGSVAISDPPDPVTLAVTLAHEVQHAKMSALLDMIPMIALGGDEARYYAPWRDDPRPLNGLLQGIYAHLAVVAFWHRQRTAERDSADSANGTEVRAHREFARWRDATAEVVRTILESGQLTDPGVTFVTGVSRALSPYLDEPVPAEISAEIRRAARRHRAQWLREHGPGLRDAAPVGH